MSGLLLGMVLSVCTCWFHNMVTLPPLLVLLNDDDDNNDDDDDDDDDDNNNNNNNNILKLLWEPVKLWFLEKTKKFSPCFREGISYNILNYYLGLA